MRFIRCKNFQIISCGDGETRNGLCNDLVRGRQSTMYRAQRLAEYALYDGDPTLFDTELDQYLAITPEQIRVRSSAFSI